MTIAIGLSCHKGVIVAADTKIAVGNNAQKLSKLYFFKGRSGAFAMAFASDDANATKTLINKIRRKLDSSECPNTVKLESLISTEMTEWRSAYGLGTPPGMQIILGARLQNDGARLYLCEPPNTFVEIDEGYVAAGTGADVTDSLNRTLFGRTHEFTDVQSALRRAAYLMYRAKEDNIFCGKSTYCVLISWNCEEPMIVNHLDFTLAEKYASELDFLLHSSAVLYLGGAESALTENSKGIAGMFEGLASFRTIPFHNVSGEVIKL